MVEVKILNTSKFDNPTYSTPQSSGVDLRANIDEPLSIAPLERVLVKTGIYLQMPDGVEAQIRPRSGLALKKGLTVLNTPGTIDSDYRGEIGVILINLSNVEVLIEPGERVCQMVFARYEQVQFVSVSSVDSTERGDGGFGHTGTN
ncbi:MAG: dUTP diphosphatase [Bacteroidales bacterium]|nr:dUTP diphosphatase [Bacteroidales bacterium]